jgi:hypothetical protein
MFLSLYDEITNALCMSLLSQDRYQYAHYTNGFDNVENVYFFYSNPVLRRMVNKISNIKVVMLDPNKRIHKTR